MYGQVVIISLTEFIRKLASILRTIMGTGYISAQFLPMSVQNLISMFLGRPINQINRLGLLLPPQLATEFLSMRPLQIAECGKGEPDFCS